MSWANRNIDQWNEICYAGIVYKLDQRAGAAWEGYNVQAVKEAIRYLCESEPVIYRLLIQWAHDEITATEEVYHAEQQERADQRREGEQ